MSRSTSSSSRGDETAYMLVASKIESSLNILASHRANHDARLGALRELEAEFAQCVVFASHGTSDESHATSAARKSAWWACQNRARSCVALGLLAHVRIASGELNRIGATVGTFKTSEEAEELALEMIACFAMLQGLALQDDESRHLCARDCILELLVDIIVTSLGSPSTKILPISSSVRTIPQHAVDLIICSLVSTPSAPARFERLGGDTEIRHFLQRCKGDESNSTEMNLLIGKCEELLLVHDFELERQERRQMESARVRNPAAVPASTGQPAASSKTSMDKVKRVRGRVSDSFERLRASMLGESPSERQNSRDHTPLSDDSFRTAKESTSSGKRVESPVKSSSRQPRREPHLDPSARTTASPRKRTIENEGHPATQKGERELRQGESRTSHTNHGQDRRAGAPVRGTTPPYSPPAQSKRQQVSRQASVSSDGPPGVVILDNDAIAASACFQRGRRPLVVMEESRDNGGLHTPSPQSPLKKIMGPSPAVKRAQARSVSPVKKEARLEAVRRRPESPTKRV